MMIGPRRWHWVSTDSAGVPRGSGYGDVARFEKKLKQHHLFLSWSWLHHCFFIYTLRGHKPITQWQCWDWANDRPQVLTNELLFLMLHYWEHHCRRSAKIIQQAAKESQEKHKRQAVKDMHEELAPQVDEAVYNVGRRRGFVAPRVQIEIPKRTLPKALRN